MSEHKAALYWKNERSDFLYESYDRTHRVRFGGGSSIDATSAKEYLGNPAIPNPEEMLAASIASCHMLTFLAVAARSRLHVTSYADEAVAHLEKDDEGVLRVTRVDLYPKIEFRDAVDPARVVHMHEKAHHACFIANSVNCEIVVH